MATVVLPVRVTADEKAELEATAQALRLTVSAYVRSRLFGPAPSAATTAKPIASGRPAGHARHAPLPQAALRPDRPGHGSHCACLGCRATGRG